MKRSIEIQACLLVFILAGCSKNNTPVVSLLISPTDQTIMTSRDQPKYQVDYVIKNQGYEVIQLQDTVTSCGCTLATIEPRVLKPGESAIVRAEVDSIPVGSKNVQIAIKTSCRTQPELLLNLKITGTGKVPYVAYSSDSIPLGQVFAAGQTERFFVETREAEGTENWLRMPKIDTQKFRITGSLKEEHSMGSGVVFRRYEYQMESIDLGKTGEFRGFVTFREDLNGQNILSLIYNGKFMPAIYISPSVIFGSFTKFDQIPQYTLMFFHDPKIKAPRINPALALHPSIKVVPIDLLDQPIKYLVTVIKPFDEGELKTEIVFKTDHESTSELRIPVHLRINPEKPK